GLTSQPFVLHHGVDKIGKFKKLVLLIIWHSLIKAICDVYQGIKTYNINGAESCRFWPSNHRSCEFIYFLNGQIHILHHMEQTHNTKDPYPVTNKSRGVFCNHRGLSKELFSILIKKIKNFFRSIGTGDDLK